jgi:hypothetical protein
VPSTVLLDNGIGAAVLAAQRMCGVDALELLLVEDERSHPFGRRLAHRPLQQQVPSLVESPHVYIVPLRVALTPSALRAAYVSGLPQLEQPGTITV